MNLEVNEMRNNSLFLLIYELLCPLYATEEFGILLVQRRSALALI